MEKRKPSQTRPSPLPVDYLNMVSEVFGAHFDSGLKALIQMGLKPRIEAMGEVHSDEVVLAISLSNEGHLSATTVYASCDFDPKASSPTVQDLLSACVDAIGAVFSGFLSPDHPEALEHLVEDSLSALSDVPFHWTEMDSNQRSVFVKIDKSNLKLDILADDWLKKHDPDLSKADEEEHQETEKLFITGPRRNTDNGSQSGQSH